MPLPCFASILLSRLIFYFSWMLHVLSPFDGLATAVIVVVVTFAASPRDLGLGDVG